MNNRLKFFQQSCPLLCKFHDHCPFGRRPFKMASEVRSTEIYCDEFVDLYDIFVEIGKNRKQIKED